MINKNSSALGKIPKSQLRTILIIVALAVVLPLVILAAKYSQDLRSKASYACLGKVTDVSYSSPCQVPLKQITATATPIKNVTPTDPNLRGKMDRPQALPVISSTNPRETQEGDGASPQPPSRDTDSQGGAWGTQPTGSNGYKVATIKCEGGYTEVIKSDSCLTASQFSAKAISICNDHAVCEKPTPSVACAKTIKESTFNTRCDNGEGEEKYKSISFTCLDGFYMKNLSPGKDSCTSSKALLNTAEKTCKGHVIKSKNLSTQCKLPSTNNRDSKNGQESVGYKSISFTCLDGFKSQYRPTICTSSTDLTNAANSRCEARLTCPSSRPTIINATPTPTDMISRPPKSPTPLPPTTTTPTDATVTPRVVTPPSTSTNQAPILRTAALTSGRAGVAYSSNISAYDTDSADNLIMEIANLPFGIYQTGCSESIDGYAYITCTISGTPVKAGTNTLTVLVKDDHGNKTTKKLYLVIK